MAAVVEHLSSLIRQGPDCCDYGDPFQWSVTVRWLSPIAVELIGMDKEPAPSIWRDVMDALDGLGVKLFLMQRIKADERHIKWVKVRPQTRIGAN